MPACPTCSAQAPEGLRFCPECGGGLQSAPAAQAAPPKPMRTMMAMRAMDAAEHFREALATALPGWAAELSKPGMSTSGGRQAVEHLVLSADGGRSVVAGRIDFTAKRAELRPHSSVREAYLARYGVAFLVSPADYDAFLGRVGDFFKRQGFALAVRADSRSQAPDSPEAPAPGFPWALLLVVLLALAGLGAAVWFLVLREQPPGAIPFPSAWPGTTPPQTGWPATVPAP